MALIRAGKAFFKRNPFVSNCLIYGSLYVGAELSQQIFQKKIFTTPPAELDKTTLGRYAVMGSFVYSPILFYWYKWLDGKFPGTSRVIIFRKLMLDMFFLTPPLLGVFFIGMSLMEFKENPFEECQKKFLQTFKHSCLFWIPVQTMNFLLIKPQMRMIFIGCTSFIWANMLCYFKRQKIEEIENES